MLTKLNFADAGHFMMNKMICISGLSNETGLCSAGYYCNGGSSTPTPVGQAYGKYLFYWFFLAGQHSPDHLTFCFCTC